MSFFEKQNTPTGTLFANLVRFNTSLSTPRGLSTTFRNMSAMDITMEPEVEAINESNYESSDPVTKAVMDNIMGKLPTKKQIVMKTCDVCKLDFSGQIVLDMHLAGAKHAKKVKAVEILSQLQTTGETFTTDDKTHIMKCEVCNIVVNSSQQLQTHLSGNKHKGKASKMSKALPMTGNSKPTEGNGNAIESTTDATGSAGASVVKYLGTSFPVAEELQPGISVLPDSANSKIKKYFCDTCSIALNSEVQVEQHVTSKKHKDKLNPKPKRPTPYSRQRAAFAPNGRKKKKSFADDIHKPLARSFVTGGLYE